MVNTRQQVRAQRAHDCVLSESKKADKEDYVRIAKKFPALVHTCGLAQATAFIAAGEDKTGKTYLADLENVMGLKNGKKLIDESRTAQLIQYQQYTLEVIESATWLKRYSEAYLEE
jgi:CRISPR-associated protein Cmr5